MTGLWRPRRRKLFQRPQHKLTLGAFHEIEWGCAAESTYVEYGMPRPANTSPQTLRVLALLLEAPRDWHYGYGVSQHTGLTSGTLYPILARLTEQGWLERRWADSQIAGRPPRHTYRLTSIGARTARQLVGSAERRPALKGARA